MREIDIKSILENEYILCHKHVVKNNKKSKVEIIPRPELIHDSKILLKSPYTDPSYYFELELETRSVINFQDNPYFKIQLHKHETSMGIMRIEYGRSSRHTNPGTFKEGMPEFLREFNNYICEDGEPHVHFYLEDFPEEELLWAMPLSCVRNIRLKDISSSDEEYQAVQEFFRLNNIISEFSLNIEIFGKN